MRCDSIEYFDLSSYQINSVLFQLTVGTIAKKFSSAMALAAVVPATTCPTASLVPTPKEVDISATKTVSTATDVVEVVAPLVADWNVGDEVFPMNFDGWTYYFRISKTIVQDLLKYGMINLSSYLPYKA